jgi:hypothetical protein
MNYLKGLGRVVRAPQGWAGLLWIAINWPANWLLPGMRTAYLFFPLWLGYILVMDALVLTRTGTSQLTRSFKNFCLLFVVSAPAWWLFEILNWRTQNWEYLGSRVFSDFEYILLCTLNFSTVMPAVFETAEWVSSFQWTKRFASGSRIFPTFKVTFGMLLLGLGMLGLTLAWPKYCYPFLWGSLVLTLEPINVWLKRQHFLEYLKQGDWRPVVSLSLGALICGFFWELWNYYSYPKWVYHTPGTEFLHIFEMPLLGYLGYLPFAWELFALRNLVWVNAPRLRL